MNLGHPLLCLVISAFFFSGCATSQYGQKITTVHYYPKCYEPINDLREADKSFNQNVIVGSVVGAALGALVGYASTGRSEGAAVGAGVGAAVGGGVGYARAKQQRIADDNKRMASYLVDIEGDISGLDRATAAARAARDCYDREFKLAVASFKEKHISRAELARRYQEIKDGSTEADNILGVTIASSTQKEQQYREAIDEEARMGNKPVPEIAAQSQEETKEKDKKITQAAEENKSPVKKTSTTGTPQTVKKAKVSTKRTAAKRTPPPAKDDTSLEAVAQNTQRLGESISAAEEEQELIRQMQEEMDGTLAILTS